MHRCSGPSRPSRLEASKRTFASSLSTRSQLTVTGTPAWIMPPYACVEGKAAKALGVDPRPPLALHAEEDFPMLDRFFEIAARLRAQDRQPSMRGQKPGKHA